MDLRLCKGVCGERKATECFEITLKNPDGTVKSRRAVCKTCYQQAKAAKAKEKSAAIDRNTVPKPTACSKCGKGCPDVEFKWRDDVAQGGWRNQCNTCFNEKNYSATSRARRRAEDEEGYLKRNAETHLAWANKNRDKVNAQLRMSKTVPERRWKALLTYVRQKHGEEWEKHVRIEDRDGLIARLSDACQYCGHTPIGDGDDDLNGLDRVDPSGIYSLDNTVSCCGICNLMKLTYSTEEFITNVRKIMRDKSDEEVVALTTIQRPRPLGKDKEREEADAKDKTCLLTENKQLELWSSGCYLCGRAPALGIDRVDASVGYEPDNCKACCTQCNYMKKDWTLEQFMGHVARIHLHTRMWVLRDANSRSSFLTGCERKPLAAVDPHNGNVLIVFPSVATASRMIMRPKKHIYHSISAGQRCKGVMWKHVDAVTYNTQCLNASSAYNILKELRRM